MVTCLLLNGYLLIACWLLNISCNIRDNTVSTTKPITYKSPIPVGTILCDCPFMNHKKTFP
jgi:hypothetical protein